MSSGLFETRGPAIRRYMSPSNRRCCKGEDASGLEVAYLAQHMLFDQIPQLQGDIELPEYTECGGLEGVNAWLGTSGTVTPLHCDSYDNLLTQAVGFKYGVCRMALARADAGSEYAPCPQ